MTLCFLRRVDSICYPKRHMRYRQIIRWRMQLTELSVEEHVELEVRPYLHDPQGEAGCIFIERHQAMRSRVRKYTSPLPSQYA